MKRLILGAVSTLVLGIVVFGLVAVYAAVGRSRGEEWGSLNGPEPVWPAVLGFGSMWLMAISAAVLGLLVLVALVRELLSGSPARR